MTVEQKFSSHLDPEQHRVRQATSEFKDFAIIWWNELVNTRAAPQTWTRLKEEMRARFVPPSYRRDLLKKLQRFDQGDMSVQEYYQELQKGMLRCGVVDVAAPPNLIRLKCGNPSPEGLESSRTSNGLK